MLRQPPSPTLFPYTTLFRSAGSRCSRSRSRRVRRRARLAAGALGARDTGRAGDARHRRRVPEGAGRRRPRRRQAAGLRRADCERLALPRRPRPRRSLDGVHGHGAAAAPARAGGAPCDRLPARPVRHLPGPLARSADARRSRRAAAGHAEPDQDPPRRVESRHARAAPHAVFPQRGAAGTPAGGGSARLDGERPGHCSPARRARRRRDRLGRSRNGPGYTAGALKRVLAAGLFVLGLATAGALSSPVIADITTSTSTTTTATTTTAPTTTVTTTPAPPSPATVPAGVRVAGVRVGGLTPADAVAAVQEAFARPLPVVVDRTRFVLDPAAFASVYVKTAV